ncbi:intraflagellar transport protein 52 homolog [Trichonephila clavipes]|nr:intraflagellar transport protein 52 homolog [Trichonephila clavipes]
MVLVKENNLPPLQWSLGRVVQVFPGDDGAVRVVDVFPPSFRELQKPALELFDLDEAFSTEKARLAQLTNKCTDEDIEYFIRECGDVLNVTDKLPSDKRDGKHILEYITSQVAEFKKLNHASME